MHSLIELAMYKRSVAEYVGVHVRGTRLNTDKPEATGRLNQPPPVSWRWGVRVRSGSAITKDKTSP